MKKLFARSTDKGPKLVPFQLPVPSSPPNGLGDGHSSATKPPIYEQFRTVESDAITSTSVWPQDYRGKDKGKEREREPENETERETAQREEGTGSVVNISRMIGYLNATALKEWSFVLEVCELASSSEINAKEAAKALRREFKYAEALPQLSAGRLWAIMLRNCTEHFLTQCLQKKFLDTVVDVVRSRETNPVFRERLRSVVADAAFATQPRPNDQESKHGFRTLWQKIRYADEPYEGYPFDDNDTIFDPLPLYRIEQGYPSARQEILFDNPDRQPVAEFGTLPSKSMLEVTVASDGYKQPSGQLDTTDERVPPREERTSSDSMSLRDKPPTNPVAGEFLDAPQSMKSRFPPVTDITHEVERDGQYPVAHGGFGDIWKGSWSRTSGTIKVAIKVLRATEEDVTLDRKLSKRLRRELRIWQRLDHPNVLELCGIVTGYGCNPSFVCPWMDKGCLTKYLMNAGSQLNLDERLQLLCDITDGLEYLHDNNVIHGDLTGANVLLDSNGRARLCDFGLSNVREELQSSTFLTSHVGGALRWSAPELFEVHDNPSSSASSLTFKSDIYSLGCVVLETLSGKIPYHYLWNDGQVLLQISRGVKPRRPSEGYITDEYWDFIEDCWGDHPLDRPTAATTRERVRQFRETSRV